MKFNMGLCQMKVTADKNANINKAVEMLSVCASKGAKLAVLPEMFNCPYDMSEFRKYAETEYGETLSIIKETALKLKMHIVAGSIPENDNGNIYNTSFVISDQGKVVLKHRKIHLFNINVSNKISFRESDVLSSGCDISVVDLGICKLFVAICFDVRFPGLFTQARDKGANVMILPGAFNMITGPAHWEVLLRARAIDNQVYFAGVSGALNDELNYKTYGHTMLVNPWGEIISSCDEKENILIGEIDTDKVNQVRQNMNLL